MGKKETEICIRTFISNAYKKRNRLCATGLSQRILSFWESDFCAKKILQISGVSGSHFPRFCVVLRGRLNKMHLSC